MVQILDVLVPEPQMVDQLVAVLKRFDTAVPEQIIAVPKVSWPSRLRRGYCSNADGGAVGGSATGRGRCLASAACRADPRHSSSWCGGEEAAEIFWLLAQAKAREAPALLAHAAAAEMDTDARDGMRSVFRRRCLVDLTGDR